MKRVVLVCMVAFAIVLRAGSVSALPLVDSECTLNGVTVLAKTPEIAGDVVVKIRKGDQRGIADLIMANQVLPIRGPVSAKVTELNAASQTIKLKIVTGPSQGMDGWIADGFCFPK